MENVNVDSLNRVLKGMKKDLSEIKENMIDKDSILTEDDYLALTAYRKEKKAGTLVAHEKLKKDLGL